MANPRVFISYSWDSADHRAWVLSLANRLVENGVDIHFDQYDIQLGRNITQKMEQNVREVDKVILILTENYKSKAEGREGGVGFEYSMISSEWYRNQDENVKFIPVLRSGSANSSIPNFVQNYLYADMREGADFEKAFEDLLRTIYGEPRIPKPPIGKRPTFSQTNRSYTPPQSPYSPPPDTIDGNLNRSNKIQSFKKKLKRLMATNELESVLDALMGFAEEEGNNRLQNDIILLLSRFNSLKSEKLSGLLANDQATMRKNQITHAVMSYIDGLK